MTKVSINHLMQGISFPKISVILMAFLLSMPLFSQDITNEFSKLQESFFDYVLARDWEKADSLKVLLKKSIKNDIDSIYFNYDEGYEYFHKGEYKLALERYLATRDEFIKRKNLEKQAQVEGAILEVISYYENTLIKHDDYLESICNIAQTTDNKFAKYDCHYFSGYFSEIKNQYDKALYHYSQIGEIALKNSDSSQYYTNLINISNALGELKLAKRSIDTLKKSYTYYKRIEDIERIFTIHSGLASQYYNLGEYDKSIEVLLNAKSDYENKLSYDNYIYLYNKLSLAYEKKGKVKKAFDYYKNYVTYIDSARNKLVEKEINSLKNEYKKLENDREILRLNDKVLETNLKRKTNLILLILFVLFTIAAIWFGSNYYKKYKIGLHEAKVLQEELELLKRNQLHDKTDRKNQMITLKNKVVLNTIDLLYLKSDGHYIEYFLESKTKPEIDRNTLTNAIEDLPNTIIRIHRSYAVNIYHVKIINSTKIMLDNGVWINLSRTYKGKLKSILSESH